MLEKIKKEILEEIRKELFEAKEVKVEVCRAGVEIPKYACQGDAGMDVRAAEDVIISKGETKIVPTGLKMVIPEGYEIQVRPRSGMSLKTGLRVANAPGTIDSGYRGEIGVMLWNTSSEDYHVKKGDRVAQLVLCKYEVMKLTELEEGSILKFTSNRGNGGYGSTGMN